MIAGHTVKLEDHQCKDKIEYVFVLAEYMKSCNQETQNFMDNGSISIFKMLHSFFISC